MSNNKGHTYNITLDLQSSAASKQVLKELQTAFANSNEDMDALNDTVKAIIKNTKDVEAAEKQYNKVVEKSLADRAEQIDKLNAEKVAIIANKDLTEEQRREALRLRDIQIDLLDNERKSIEAKRDELAITIKTTKAEQDREKKLAKARQKEVELLEKLNKTFKSNFTENSKMFKLTNQMVKAQEKLNNLIGKESKLRKAASKVVSAGAKVGGAALKAGGALAAVGGVLAGAAAGSANDLAEKERALTALKSGIDPTIVDQVYIKSGADYGTIVEAVNKLSSVTKDSGLLIQGAVLELQNPGIGKVLLSQSEMKQDGVSKLSNAIAQIKKQTGIQDMSAALEASTNSRVVTKGVISQTDYLQAYAALAQQGLEEEDINKIIKGVARQSGDFITNLNSANLSKYIRGEQAKNRLNNVKLNLETLDPSKSPEASAAQSTAEKLRQFELKKNELLLKMFPVVDKVLTEIVKVMEGEGFEKLVNGLVGLFTNVLPLLEPVFELLNTVLKLLEPILDVIKPVAKSLIDGLLKFLEIKAPQQQQKSIEGANEDASKLQSKGSWFSAWGMRMANAQFAQGGIATAPSICGEAGPELIIPLDNSRSGRASQIVNNFNTNQNFNMSANQTTPLAFAQAVGQNRFVRRTAC